MKRLIEGKIQKGLQQHAEQRVKADGPIGKGRQDAQQSAVKQSTLNTNSCAKGNRQGPKAKAMAIQHRIKAYQGTYWG